MTKFLHELVPEIEVTNKELVVSGVSDDSRTVKRGDLFLAYQGECLDRKLFIPEVLARGGFVLSDQPVGEQPGIWFYPKLRERLGLIAERFYGHPSQQMKIIGVTGTNGKGTVTTLLYNVLKALGERVALIGTLGFYVEEEFYSSINTTPGAIELTYWLDYFAQKKVGWVIMEISAHALSQYRVEHLNFEKVVFTNLTRDHLDYYSSMEEYGKAKKRLFTVLKSKEQIVNLDDSWGEALFKELPQALGYSLMNPTDIWGMKVSCNLEGCEILLQTPWGLGRLNSQLIGKFNASNLLAVVATLGKDFPLFKVIQKLSLSGGVQGRLECFKAPGKPLVIVDYAHNPEALRGVLTELGKLKRGRLGLVFGCGGERDLGKRPLMGKIAEEAADWIILTSDNSRSEDGRKIVEEIILGMKKFPGQVILDRRLAITQAIYQANAEDIVLLAGRGHETHLIMGEQHLFFSDQEVVKEVMGL